MWKMIKAGLLTMCITSTLSTIMGLFFVDEATRKMLLAILILGFGIGALSKIYEFPKLPMIVQTLIHLGGSYLIFLLAAYIGGWFPFTLGVVLGSSLLFLVIFFIFWTFYYLKAKKEVADINHKIQK